MFKIKYKVVCRFFNSKEDQNPATITHTYHNERMAIRTMKLFTKADGNNIICQNNYLSIVEDEKTGALTIYEIHPEIKITENYAPLMCK